MFLNIGYLRLFVAETSCDSFGSIWDREGEQGGRQTIDLRDIYRIFHVTAADYTFFLSTHETFPRVDHMTEHKTSLSKFKKNQIIPIIFSSTME